MKKTITLAILAFLGPAALGDDVTVDCDGGPADFNDLQEAISSLDPDIRNAISVIGTCQLPPPEPGFPGGMFVVDGFRDLTIQGDGSTTLFQLSAVCGTPLQDQGLERLRSVFRVTGSRGVRLSGLTITGGRGLDVDDSELHLNGQVIVENSFDHGIGLGGEAGSRVVLGAPGNEIRTNCRAGVSVGRGSTASIGSDAWIHDNQGFGARTSDTGRINVLNRALVEGNLRGGVSVRFGGSGVILNQATIQNNGNNPNPDDPLFALQSGVAVTFGSDLFIGGPRRDPDTGVLDPGPVIQNNTGPGVLLDLNSTVALRNLTIQGNSGSGLNVLGQSVAELQPESTVLQGNTSGDVECDGTSLVRGDFSGVASNKCSTAQPDKTKTK